MSNIIIHGTSAPLKGEFTPPGDKSISHRALILGAISKGTTKVTGFPQSDDVISTANAMRALGADIEMNGTDVLITGNGLNGLKEPADVIDTGNSGTTTRLLAGLLSAQTFFTALTGDQYLRARPMKRVVDPLIQMGARIAGRENGNKLPLAITGSKLAGISYNMPVASAQVKSALLLAGLYTEEITEIIEPQASRDHTERMLSYLGVSVERQNNSVKILKPEELQARDIKVPSDISSAAFFIVAALINPGSEILIKNVGTNPLRTGIIDILINMGAKIEVLNERELNGEPVGDIVARSSRLRGVEIAGDLIPKSIDELPIAAVAAAFAEGETVIREASELRVKETDRIKAISSELAKLGADVRELKDGMVIRGKENLIGATCQSWGDHRIAMSAAVAATRAQGQTVIEDSDCVSVSYPGFFDTLDQLRK